MKQKKSCIRDRSFFLKGGSSLKPPKTFVPYYVPEEEYYLRISHGFIIGCMIVIFLIFYLLQQLYMMQSEPKIPRDPQISLLGPYHIPSATYMTQTQVSESNPSCHANIFTNPYMPPMNTSNFVQRTYDVGSGQIPINIPTRNRNLSSISFSQLGILTKETPHPEHPLILPLMGRVTDNARDKYQYYTVSNTGAVNTKLQIRIKNKICTNEYGCDELYDGDSVYVQGYNDLFHVTIYENYTNTYHANVL